jgi:3'-phosphoadenosine 5'-phosphosulfate (PAPS) 3'-phosphatase
MDTNSPATDNRILSAAPLVTILPPEIIYVPQPTTAAKGMTGEALRTANDTITKMHQQAITQRHAIEQLRTALAEAHHDNETLRDELARARRMTMA